MCPRKGKEVRLGDALGSFIKKADRDGRSGQSRAVEVWRKVVGPDVAKHTFGITLRRGELVVAVDSAPWASELSIMSDELRARINSEMGQETVREIRFTVSRRVEDEHRTEQAVQDAVRKYSPEIKTRPISLSPEEIEAVRKSVSVISDEELRDAAFKATVVDLEWKKGHERLNVSEKGTGGAEGPETEP